tara:strand:- start:21694 stop:22329 length:636 start_codon:yes stop_codon:yes gene_type:complete
MENESLDSAENTEPPSEVDSHSFIVLNDDRAPEKLRIVGLYGEVEEAKCSELIYSMLMLRNEGRETDEEGNVSFKPFECYVSTHGGAAADMFAVYDVMRMIRKDCEIRTVGIGKVMSAGVLLLAAGTKGQRKIGANCRVMLHSVSSHHQGSLHELKNELEEVNWIQEQNIKALQEETSMTEEFIRELLERNTNIYLTAAQAVEFGIADEIV